MLNKLYKLANRLDKVGFPSVADEIDSIIKKAINLTPEREKEIEESVDRYFANPEKRERDLVEQEYGLGPWSEDDEDVRTGYFGLESTPWHGQKWSYEGYPKDKAEHFKNFERYQTVIGDDPNLPEKIDDPAEGGFWVREQVFDKPEGASKGTYQTVYRFIDSARVQRRKELYGDEDDISPELKGFLANLDKEEVETPEVAEDSVEVQEEKPHEHGGGTRLF